MTMPLSKQYQAGFADAMMMLSFKLSITRRKLLVDDDDQFWKGYKKGMDDAVKTIKEFKPPTVTR